MFLARKGYVSDEGVYWDSGNDLVEPGVYAIIFIIKMSAGFIHRISDKFAVLDPLDAPYVGGIYGTGSNSVSPMEELRDKLSKFFPEK
jgi:hypothetical protein